MNEEYPTTDVEEIKSRLDRLETALAATNDRLDGQATGINSIGENMMWLVNNVQGIFQMFASPQFMSQMTNLLMGQVNNARTQDGPGADGANPGAEGASILGQVERDA